MTPATTKTTETTEASPPTDFGRFRRFGRTADPLWPDTTCPMCEGEGQRVSVVDGALVTCPWCGGRGVVSLWRACALRAQVRAKAARKREQAA